MGSVVSSSVGEALLLQVSSESLGGVIVWSDSSSPSSLSHAHSSQKPTSLASLLEEEELELLELDEELLLEDEELELLELDEELLEDEELELLELDEELLEDEELELLELDEELLREEEELLPDGWEEELLLESGREEEELLESGMEYVASTL